MIYAIKKDHLRFFGCNKIKDIKTREKKGNYDRQLSAFKLHQDRRTNIVAYKGAMQYQKTYPMVNWTAIVAYRDAIFNQVQKSWFSRKR